MPDLYITLALPNPFGKDRPPHGAPSNVELNNEWMQFNNASGRNLDISEVTLSDHTFNYWCQKTGERVLATFTGTLDSGYAIRVHTGSGETFWEGEVRHVYLERSNYIWNNQCGDMIILRAESGGTIDWAQYSPQPGEGQILRRRPGTNILS